MGGQRSNLALLLLLLLLDVSVAINVDGVVVNEDNEERVIDDDLPFFLKEYLADKAEPISVLEEPDEPDEPDDLDNHLRRPLQLRTTTSTPFRVVRELFFRDGRRFISPHEFVKRRLCIPPTMSCNLRPNSCCSNSTCRCNLWGQNCRCLRMGLFQRWGRKK